MIPNSDAGAPLGAPPVGRRLLPATEVHFLCEARPEVAAALAAPGFDAAMAENAALRARFAQDGVLCWTVQTYLRLREAGYSGISLGHAPLAGAINIATALQLLRQRWWRSHFCVAIEADYPRIPWAELQIQQNPANCRAHDLFLPLWPQPALIPRDPTRREVRTVTFFGKSDGNLALGPERLDRILSPEGFVFRAPGDDGWHDYSATDIAVGIRSFDRRRYDNRPASKLINAWRAGVPFIGGHDSAFRAAGQPGSDYLVADSPAALLAALVRLRDEPSLYAALVAAGHAAAQRYTTETLVDAWVAAIRGPIRAHYEAWRAHPRQAAWRRRSVGHLFAFAQQAKAVSRLLRGMPWRWP